jgi:uncharacterized metal-binding protein YceD (DUF177 family)
MADKIAIDRFTRLKQSVSGQFRPFELPRLVEFLPADSGEIQYSLAGSTAADATGRQTKRLKCIISGWFLLLDPVTLKPERFELSINSKLVVVATEAELPPLEAEADDEDYIVCAVEMDVRDLIEEEVLLDLPGNVVRVEAASAKSTKAGLRTTEVQKVSPFAKLATLKKKG